MKQRYIFVAAALLVLGVTGVFARQQTTDNGQPTTNREQTSSFELPRCEGGKACKAGLIVLFYNLHGL